MSTAPASFPVAIITGAGSGIGLATAHMLRKEGYALVLAARNAETLGRAAEELRATTPGDPPVTCLPSDISKPAQARAMIDAAHERFGRVDVLVNNAGLAKVIPIARNAAEDLEAIYATNAMGPANAIVRAWPIFESQRRGCVVNISTKGTADPFPGFFAYAAAKSALNSMVRSCAKEGARIGVRAFAVAPGAVETGMLRSMFPERSLPTAACLAPADVARVIVNCITGQRDHDNGKTIYLRRDERGGIEERVE